MVKQPLGTRACAPQGRRVTDSFLVRGPSQRELQGRAAEGRAGNLSLRIELISPHLQPASPPSLCAARLKVTTVVLCLHQVSAKEEVAFQPDADEVEVGGTCTW